MEGASLHLSFLKLVTHLLCLLLGQDRLLPQSSFSPFVPEAPCLLEDELALGSALTHLHCNSTNLKPEQTHTQSKLFPRFPFTNFQQLMPMKEMQLRCSLSLYKPQLCYSPLDPSSSYQHKGAVGVKLVKLHAAARRVEKHPFHLLGPKHGTNDISPAPGHSIESVRNLKLCGLSLAAALLTEQLTISSTQGTCGTLGYRALHFWRSLTKLQPDGEYNDAYPQNNPLNAICSILLQLREAAQSFIFFGKKHVLEGIVEFPNPFELLQERLHVLGVLHDQDVLPVVLDRLRGPVEGARDEHLPVHDGELVVHVAALLVVPNLDPYKNTTGNG